MKIFLQEECLHYSDYLIASCCTGSLYADDDDDGSFLRWPCDECLAGS